MEARSKNRKFKKARSGEEKEETRNRKEEVNESK